MTESHLVSEGLNLMLVGMGFVFVFLTMLVIVTALMSFIITRYEKNVGVLPEDGIPAPTAVVSQVHGSQRPPHEDANLITVLTTAVHRFRSRHK